MANDYEGAGASWAAGETGAVEGVQETIAPAEAPASTEAPAPSPVPVTPATQAPTLAESSEAWARDDKGRFAAKPEETLATETPAATEEVERPATQAEIQAVIKAQLNGKELDVPENLMVPLKRNGTVTMVPLKDVMASGMMEQDYRHKTSDLARQRQEINQMNSQLAAEHARAVERSKILQEEHDAWQEAKKDPAKLAQWEAHYEQMRNNPMYAKAWNDANRVREVEAENRVLHEQTESRVAEDTTRQLAQAITDMGAQYPGIDPKRIMAQYGLILKAGEVDRIDMNHVAQLYQREAATYISVVQPVQQQVETLTKELEAIKKLQAAVATNAQTDKVIARAAAPNLAPVGSPQSHAKAPPKPFTSEEYEERRNAWARER